MSTSRPHPFDPEDSKVAIRSPQPKAPKRDNIRRELDRIQRQLEGLSKTVKKIKEAT